MIFSLPGMHTYLSIRNERIAYKYNKIIVKFRKTPWKYLHDVIKYNTHCIVKLPFNATFCEF